LSPKRVNYYFFAQPLFSTVFYDATLQGGLIADRSVYKVKASSVSRFVMQINYGFVIQYKCLFASYSRAYQTKEVAISSVFNWGGIHLGYRKSIL